MRETKFRIKYLGDDSLGIPSLATPPGWRYIYLPCQFRGEELYCRESSYDWDTFTQWTGLKDNNGQEIYEGDIVEWEESWNCNCGNTWNKRSCFGFVQMWCGNWCVARTKLGYEHFEPTQLNSFAVTRDDEYKNYYPNEKLSVTIIGNIYENQELLEKS